MVARPLTNDSQSEEVLPTATLATDGNGYRSIRMKGSFATSQDFFWIIDTRTLTYRIFNLTENIDEDANRILQVIQENLQAEATAVPVERLRRRIEEAQSRKQSRMAEFSARSKAAASTSFPTCYGGGQAAIRTFDAVLIRLTETYTWADWEYPGDGTFQSHGGGRCWANPKTILRTSWYVEACDESHNATPYRSYTSTANLAYNNDFMFDSEFTWVNQGANVLHNNGSAAWDVWHRDWGEANFLIFGITLLGSASC